jgi:uncharacterized membrane protein YccC
MKAPVVNPPLPGPLRRAFSEWGQADGLIWIFIGKLMLTAGIALWLAYRLELPQPSTVLVTVCVVMQRQSGEVLAKSFYRLIGSVLGLTVMVTLIALFNQERLMFLLCLAIWIGLCTAGAARYRDFRGYACVLAGYTAVMIGLPAAENPDGAFMQALWRMLEISLGIICAGLVSGLILPQTSSKILHRGLSARMRDFADFACEGLAGNLDEARIGQVNAHLAGDAVRLEILRNSSVFEDPLIRMRTGRLGRLNNEFMVLTTRFHALIRLMQRLQYEGGLPVLEALQPCLQLVSSVLQPLRGQLFQEADAAMLTWRLQHNKDVLRRRIRTVRAELATRIDDEDRMRDFNTAAELLFRFSDDLNNYAQTHASLKEHHHSREHWTGSFTPRANGMAVAVLGLRSAFLMSLLSVFWITSSWPSGDVAVQTMGLIAGLTAVAQNCRRQALKVLIGATASAIVGFSLMFWVLPWLDGFAMLLCAISPVFVIGGWLLSRPNTAGYGVGLLVWFCMMSLPGNLTHYLPYQYLNDFLAILLALLFAFVGMSLILPPDSPWLWQRLEKDLRMRLVFAVGGKLKGLEAQFESGTHDLLNQAYTLAANRPDVQSRLLSWMFVVWEIGQSVIELRQEEAVLPKLPCYAENSPWRQSIRPLGRALVRLFIQPDEANRQRALTAVTQALESVHATPEPGPQHFDQSPLRRVASYLHFIRSSLLDPLSPLAGSPSP